MSARSFEDALRDVLSPEDEALLRMLGGLTENVQLVMCDWTSAPTVWTEVYLVVRQADTGTWRVLMALPGEVQNRVVSEGMRAGVRVIKRHFPPEVGTDFPDGGH